MCGKASSIRSAMPPFGSVMRRPYSARAVTRLVPSRCHLPARTSQYAPCFWYTQGGRCRSTLRWRIQGFPEDDNTTVRPQPVGDAERSEHPALRAAAHAFGESDEFGGAQEHGTGDGFTPGHG